MTVVQMKRPSPPGDGLLESERLTLTELSRIGAKALAEQRGMPEALLEARLAELMYRPEARAFLARCMDARVVGILAPAALKTTLDLLERAANDRTRLAAARLAYELMGVLGRGDAGMPAAAVAAGLAAQQARRSGGAEALKGLPAAELLAKIEELEEGLKDQPEGDDGPVIDGVAVSTLAPEDTLPEGGIAW